MSTNTDTMPSCEVNGRCAILTLNNPDRFNPIDEHVVNRLSSHIDGLRTSRDIDAFIITGSGKAFSGGGNIHAFHSGLADQDAYADYVEKVLMRDASNPLMIAIQNSPKPFICAVNGIAAGIGASLALGCDFVLAARSASFVAPFMPNLGLLPDMGMTWQVPRLIGKARAMKMMLLGERISAQQAENWGMIFACIEDSELIGEAMKLADRLGNLPAHAVSEIRAAINIAHFNSFDDQLEYETERQQQLLRKYEFREGVESFLEKRKPDFRNFRK